MNEILPSNPPRTPQTGLLILLFASLVVVALMGAAATFFLIAARIDQNTRSQASQSLDTSQVDLLMGTIRELQAFVEVERGLTFSQDVKVTLLSDEEFRNRLVQESREEFEQGQNRDAEDVLKALRLIGPDVDLAAQAEVLLGEAILGYYDPESDELVVRGQELDPFTRMVLAHELTHALQDQRFNLDRPEYTERKDDIQLGLQALAEGDAGRIDRRFFESLGPEDRRFVEAEEGRFQGAASEVPDVLLSLLAFPYQFGPSLVDTLLNAGGRERLDEAFRSPPTTTEQIIHPGRFLAGEGAMSVEPPPAEGEVFDDGVVGELGLILLLGEALPPRTALTAAEGWGGDYYVAWRHAGGTCLRFDIVMDTVGDRRELVAALRSWANHHGSANIRAGNTTRVTACS